MKLNWNFLGEGGMQNKNLPWGEYGYFLELHNKKKYHVYTVLVSFSPLHPNHRAFILYFLGCLRL